MEGEAGRATERFAEEKNLTVCRDSNPNLAASSRLTILTELKVKVSRNRPRWPKRFRVG
jgi:hypothetical protein